MKKIKSFLFLVLLLSCGVSCKKDFLDEKPLDFLSSANAFQTAADFNASVNNLFRLLRQELFTSNDNDPFEYTYRTDIAKSQEKTIVIMSFGEYFKFCFFITHIVIYMPLYQADAN